MLKLSKCAYYFLAPLLTICTALIFGLALYWSQCLRSKFLYKRVKNVSEATHVEIDGMHTAEKEIHELKPVKCQYLGLE